MWTTIRNKIMAGVVRYWSQIIWFILGLLLGFMLLGGLVSCTPVEEEVDTPVLEELEEVEDAEVPIRGRVR